MKLTNFLHDIMLANKEYDLNFDSFSIGQLQSKEWAVEILKDVRMIEKIHDFGNVFNLCGWYGILPAMMYVKDVPFAMIRSFDIDERCKAIADRINRTTLQDSWRFQAVTQDIFDLNFEDDFYQLYSYGKEQWFDVREVPHTIINTSCEHTSADWYHNVPSDKFVLLQSNDSFDEEGHINAVTNIDEFKEMYPMRRVLYDGVMSFDKYKRFMLVGIK